MSPMAGRRTRSSRDARADPDQPVLRELDPDPDLVRARRQAARRRRRQHVGRPTSSIKKGETLIDTAMTLNAMHPDVLVARHPDSGAVALLARHVNCAVINAGDGSHEHPTQALLRRAHDQAAQGPDRGPDGRDLRRYSALEGRALEPSAADRDGREGAARGAEDAAAGRGRALRGRGVPRHGPRARWRRHRDDAAAADRAHAGQLRALGARVFPSVRPDLRQARRARAPMP